ncbi:MAG: F420-dependent methylenetetrahydromethanopterin dehydrogenase [Euryarchaeota archaeon]|nr:F420-dependent methylenetetrahydromethanopterin dehydrogenase [Euryarchaeota archaeon]
MAKVGVLKLGNIGVSPLLEHLLDERADRGGLDVRAWSSGTKMGEPEAALAEEVNRWGPDLSVLVSPNTVLPGPARARAILKAPLLIVSDGAARKAARDLERPGVGYILFTGDAMLGARRELLDPTEMVLFNSDILRVLSVCGALRLLHQEIDGVLDQVQRKASPLAMPRLVADGPTVVARAGFSSPYAHAKALAAYAMCEKAAQMAHEACFVLKEPIQYVPLAAAVHESVRAAARLADEAREMEKGGDRVYRTPHDKAGGTQRRRGLLGKPEG